MFLMCTRDRRVKLITFTRGMTAFPARNRRLAAIRWSRGRRGRASAAGEGRQHLNHRTIVEHDRLLRGTAHRIGVYQERRPRDDVREAAVRFPAGNGRVEGVTKGDRIHGLLRQTRRVLRCGPVPDGYVGHMSDILTSTGPRAMLPPGPICVYTDNDGSIARDRRWHHVSELLLVTGVLEPSSEVLPALGLLLHSVRVVPADASALVEAPPADVVLVDARRDLAHAKSICRLLHTTGLDCPMLAIVTEGGLAAISAEWNADDVILNTAGPAEVEARLRLATGRRAMRVAADAPDEIRSGDLAIDEATYSARLRGRVLDLTFKEFELLKFLAQHPGRVFTRAHLLQEVWGYDYFGGTRTVDVHVRRLRAKLGPEHEALIGTVRNVGYKAVRPARGRAPVAERDDVDDAEADADDLQTPLVDPLRSQ